MKEELCTDQCADSVKYEPKLTATVTAESVHSNCFAVNRYYALGCCHKHFKTFFLGIEYQISGSQSGVNEDSRSTGLGRLVCQYIVNQYFEGFFCLNLQHIPRICPVTLLRRVDWLTHLCNFVSQQRSASIFKVKYSEAPPPCQDSLTPKRKAASPQSIYQSTRRHIPKDLNLPCGVCKNVKW